MAYVVYECVRKFQPCKKMAADFFGNLLVIVERVQFRAVFCFYVFCLRFSYVVKKRGKSDIKLVFRRAVTGVHKVCHYVKFVKAASVALYALNARTEFRHKNVKKVRFFKQFDAGGRFFCFQKLYHFVAEPFYRNTGGFFLDFRLKKFRIRIFFYTEFKLGGKPYCAYRAESVFHKTFGRFSYGSDYSVPDVVLSAERVYYRTVCKVYGNCVHRKVAAA